MSQKYCLLATEGPNDQAAIGRLLQLSGLKKFDGTKKDLDPFWEGFIPIYPKGGNLYTRMDMPSILTSPTHSIAIYWGEGRGKVTVGIPRTGIYVLPNNKRSGVLDSVLVDCASVIYPDHKNGALRFINGLDKIHTERLNAGAKSKAIVSCIASILRPSQSNTPSIAHDKWISEHTANNEDLVLLKQFLKDLLEMP